MTVETDKRIGKVGACSEVVEVERVLPVATAREKRLRFPWEQLPSEEFLMNWNHRMEPNQVFVERLDETGLTVTVRWGLMNQTPEKIGALINRWLEQCETGGYKRSGRGGFRLQ